MIGILFGVALLIATTIVAVIPVASDEQTEDTGPTPYEDQVVDTLFPIRVTYVVLMPLVAIGTWIYYSFIDIYQVVRPKRVTTAW